MIGVKLVWLIAVQFMVFKGFSGLNANQKEIAPLNATPLAQTPSSTEGSTSSTNRGIGILRKQNATLIPNSSTTASQTRVQIVELFGGDFNKTVTEEIGVSDAAMPDCLNLTSTDQLLNNTLKSNYTTLAEAVGASEDLNAFRLQNTAAVAAAVFLVSAVIGYLSCVGYRRFLQQKYGNGQILVGEEVYDTTDLKYFEI